MIDSVAVRGAQVTHVPTAAQLHAKQRSKPTSRKRVKFPKLELQEAAPSRFRAAVENSLRFKVQPNACFVLLSGVSTVTVPLFFVHAEWMFSIKCAWVIPDLPGSVQARLCTGNRLASPTVAVQASVHVDAYHGLDDLFCRFKFFTRFCFSVRLHRLDH